MVGNVGVGGDNPIRIQSMTNSPTRDVDATVEQVIRLADAGCEIARVTVQGKKEADACEAIKNTLLQKGYTIPLVADIHFYPPAAMRVIEFVDKVRVNPGNYLDKRATFKTLEYTDEQYQEEIRRLEENFAPLVIKCKTLGKAMRIGTNHGSLSDRIMNRYGDTPAGMLESALEYARVCRAHDFHDIVFSMKASNTKVKIEAYRLLVAAMMELGWDYPLHLGVTEAGEGEDGRIRSAIGMGSLLLDGIGDTIRVSLTEDPWKEIDPCKRLVAFAEECQGKGVEEFDETTRDITHITRRDVKLFQGMHPSGTVALNLSGKEVTSQDLGLGTEVQVDLVKGRAEGIESIPENTVVVDSTDNWQALLDQDPKLVLLRPGKEGRVQFCRQFFDWLKKRGSSVPVLLNFTYEGDWDDVVIAASAECGSLLCDGLGDGLMLEGAFDFSSLRTLSFNILQGCRMRSTKTEFISCPSCGRTLFNIQQVAERIRQRTGHLPGVKIAIMGCIVNGPGEMADADFGYVGSGAGKVDLYVGKACVEKGIAMDDADDRLIELIKKYDRWVEC